MQDAFEKIITQIPNFFPWNGRKSQTFFSLCNIQQKIYFFFVKPDKKQQGRLYGRINKKEGQKTSFLI